MTRIADFTPTKYPVAVEFPIDGTPVPVSEVSSWLQTGCPKIHAQMANFLNEHFETIAFVSFPDSTAMAVVGKLNAKHGAYNIPACAMTRDHGIPALTAIWVMVNTYHTTTQPTEWRAKLNSSCTTAD